MKKKVLLIGVISMVLVTGFFNISCVSTKKLTPDLTSSNAATIELKREYKVGNSLDGKTSCTLGIHVFDGEAVTWDKNMKVLIPEGEHKLNIAMFLSKTKLNANGGLDYYNLWFGRADISITVQAGKKYTIQCLPASPLGNVNVQLVDVSTSSRIFDQEFILPRER